MANPNPPKPPSIYEIGLANHLAPIHADLYDELVKLDAANLDNPAISRYLFENGFTKDKVDRRTIARWRKVLHHELKAED